MTDERFAVSQFDALNDCLLSRFDVGAFGIFELAQQLIDGGIELFDLDPVRARLDGTEVGRQSSAADHQAAAEEFWLIVRQEPGSGTRKKQHDKCRVGNSSRIFVIAPTPILVLVLQQFVGNLVVPIVLPNAVDMS